MFKTIKEQPMFRQLVSRYDQMSQRDQRALQVLSVALLIFIVYFLIWRPASTYHTEAVDNHQSAEELLAWMRNHRADIAALESAGAGDSASAGITGTRDLMQTVTRSAGEQGLALQRFEPSGEGDMRVWMEDVAFNQVARWLELLRSEYGIRIDQVAVDRKDRPGIVSVRLTLTTG